MTHFQEMTNDELVAVMEDRGYVVVTGEQWGYVVDALGPASDDVLDRDRNKRKAEHMNNGPKLTDADRAVLDAADKWFDGDFNDGLAAAVRARRKAQT